MSVSPLKVSIILPTFNGASYIHQAIESCLNQTYRNLELIVINDGSTDHTVEKINTFQDPRLKVIHLEKNQGHIAALNQGFSLAIGDFLTWTSDDNYYAPQAIEQMVLELNHTPSVDFVYAHYDVINELGNVQRKGRVEDPEMLDMDNYIGGCFLYRRKVYETIGDFNPDAFLAEDYEYWLRVREKFRMKKMEATLYYYRMHTRSLTGIHQEEKVQQKVEAIRDRFVPAWKKYYFHGKKSYEQNDYAVARKDLFESFKGNPFYGPTWRLMVLSSLEQSIIDQIRRVKHVFRK